KTDTRILAQMQAQLVVEVLLMKFHLIAVEVVAFRERPGAVTHRFQYHVDEQRLKLLGNFLQTFRRVLPPFLRNGVETREVGIDVGIFAATDHAYRPCPARRAFAADASILAARMAVPRLPCRLLPVLRQT